MFFLASGCIGEAITQRPELHSVYTALMSWSFRALILMVVLVWGIAPQVACFMPEQALTQDEMDCCQKMANDCGQMNMTCCRTVTPRHIVGVTAKPIQKLLPHAEFATNPLSAAVVIPRVLPFSSATQNDHAPPPLDSLASSSILRI